MLNVYFFYYLVLKRKKKEQIKKYLSIYFHTFAPKFQKHLFREIKTNLLKV
jgi:hypothetical protein